MFSSNKDIAVYMSHLEKPQLAEVLTIFKLKRLEEGEHVLSEDCILLRGSCIIQHPDENNTDKV